MISRRLTDGELNGLEKRAKQGYTEVTILVDALREERERASRYRDALTEADETARGWHPPTCNSSSCIFCRIHQIVAAGFGSAAQQEER